METLDYMSSTSQILDDSLTSSPLPTVKSHSIRGTGGEEERKAEPNANFLDYVTTRLARENKRVSYSCNFCGQDLTSMPEVKEHIPQHVDQLNFPCDRPTCPKSFSSLYDQLRHQDRHVRKERKKRRRPSPPSPTHTISSNNSSSCVNVNSNSNSRVSVDDDSQDFYMQRFCLCNQIAFGQMIYCDSKNCPMEWFHFSCVGLKSKAPRGTWHCPPCKSRYRRKGTTTYRSTTTRQSNFEPS